eukprot:Filipodium_phascolosomae@DN4519_c0_g1_i1.p1
MSNPPKRRYTPMGLCTLRPNMAHPRVPSLQPEPAQPMFPGMNELPPPHFYPRTTVPQGYGGFAGWDAPQMAPERYFNQGQDWSVTPPVWNPTWCMPPKAPFALPRIVDYAPKCFPDQMPNVPAMLPSCYISSESMAPNGSAMLPSYYINSESMAPPLAQPATFPSGYIGTESMAPSQTTMLPSCYVTSESMGPTLPQQQFSTEYTAGPGVYEQCLAGSTNGPTMLPPLQYLGDEMTSQNIVAETVSQPSCPVHQLENLSDVSQPQMMMCQPNPVEIPQQIFQQTVGEVPAAPLLHSWIPPSRMMMAPNGLCAPQVQSYIPIQPRGEEFMKGFVTGSQVPTNFTPRMGVEENSVYSSNYGRVCRSLQIQKEQEYVRSHLYKHELPKQIQRKVTSASTSSSDVIGLQYVPTLN